MSLFSTKPVLAAGLAALLTLGAAGCSYSASTTTEVSTTTSTDGGTETTTSTTTTTTSTDNSSSSSSSADTASTSSYTNDAFGIVVETPANYTVNPNVSSSAEIERVVYYAEDGAGNSIAAVRLDAQNLKASNITDIDTWVNAHKDAALKTLSSDATVESTQSGTFSAGSTTAPTLLVTLQKDGKTTLREFIFFMDSEGDALRFDLEANDEATLKQLDSAILAKQ